MGFIRKILDTLSTKKDKQKITDQLSDCRDNHDSHEELTISELNDQIDRVNELTALARKTTDRTSWRK